MLTMDRDERRQLEAEQERILAMPGRVPWTKLKRLSRTAKIFAGNADALIEHLNRMQDPSVLLPTSTNPEAFEAFLDETERHLHNYVAAAQTRVHHFRQFARDEWPEESALRNQYQQRIDQEFKASPLHNFIIRLRNLIQHQRLPVTRAQESWQRGGPLTFQVMLDSADLLRSDDWNAKAREYIEASGKSVDLGRTVDTYTSKIMAFDRWVAERFREEHSEEIESFLGAARQHQAKLRRLGLYNDPETP
jgi:hypothetical protein